MLRSDAQKVCNLMWIFGTRQSWAIEAMKRCDEALNTSSLQFFASVKRFIASLLHCFNFLR
jgi:hypothetical protein